MSSLSPVSFHGNTLFVVPVNEEPFTPMKPIVEGMGLDWRAQAAKFRSNKDRWGVVMIATPSDGGKQDAVCLPVRKLPAWMASINPKKVREEIRPRVILYQNECDDALWSYWTKGRAERQPDPTPALPRRSTAKERNRLAALMDAYIGAMGVNPSPEAYKAAWRKIHRMFGVKDIAHLTVDQLPVAERFLEELAKMAKPKALPPAKESTVRDYAGVYKNLPAHNALWKQLKMRLYNASAAYGRELAEIRDLAAQPFKECRKSDIGTFFDSVMDPIGAHFQAAESAEHASFCHASNALSGYMAAHDFLTRG